MAAKPSTPSIDFGELFEGASSQFKGLNINQPGQWPPYPLYPLLNSCKVVLKLLS